MYIFIYYIILTIALMGIFTMITYHLGNFLSGYFIFLKSGIKLPLSPVIIFLILLEFLYFILFYLLIANAIGMS